MSKHTPGPWVVDGEKGEYVSQRYGDETGIAHVLCIDEDGDRWVRGDVTHANARLLAAAPNLLAALITAETMLCLAEGLLDLHQDDSPNFEPAILAARDAIKAARGEQ